MGPNISTRLAHDYYWQTARHLNMVRIDIHATKLGMLFMTKLTFEVLVQEVDVMRQCFVNQLQLLRDSMIAAVERWR